jgi:hypothetical protein
MGVLFVVTRFPRQRAPPKSLVITTPREGYPESAVKVNKANVATRVSP